LKADKNIILHEYVVFALSKNKSPSEVTLRSAEWAVITQTDGHKSIKDVAEILALSIDEAVGLFQGLYKKGLISVVSIEKTEEEFVSESFFNLLEKELTIIIGPVAPFVLEDTMWAIDADKKKFSKDRVPELIENLSDEITDNDKRVQFQKVMLGNIRGLNEN
jgi:hypothetical protein